MRLAHLIENVVMTSRSTGAKLLRAIDNANPSNHTHVFWAAVWGFGGHDKREEKAS